MSWYIHPSKQLREDELPPELVVTNGDGSVQQVYVPHRTTTRHGKFRTKYGRSVPCCECCGYGIGDARWNYCPSCGAEVVDE